MKVYISGPMSGYSLYNFPAFDEAAASLREAGHEVFSPAENDRALGFDPVANPGQEPTREHIVNALAWDIARVFECDVVAALSGWPCSKGARIEIGIARLLGKPVGFFSKECLAYVSMGSQRLFSEPCFPYGAYSEASLSNVLDFKEDGIIEGHQDAENILSEPILTEAARLVSTERQEAYGHPRDNFANIAAMWSVLLHTDVLPRDVGLCMAALKLARESHMPQRDNLVDAAGYIAAASMCDEK